MGELNGSHAVFGADDFEYDFVLIQGHMGNVSLRWFTMGDGFTLSERKHFEGELKDNEGYDDILWDNEVSEIDYVSAYSFDKEHDPQTHIYCYGLTPKEYDELHLDFTYDNEWFR